MPEPPQLSETTSGAPAGWRLAHTTAEASMRDVVLHETAEGFHEEDGNAAVNHHFAVGVAGGLTRLYVRAPDYA